MKILLFRHLKVGNWWNQNIKQKLSFLSPINLFYHYCSLYLQIFHQYFDNQYPLGTLETVRFFAINAIALFFDLSNKPPQIADSESKLK